MDKSIRAIQRLVAKRERRTPITQTFHFGSAIVSSGFSSDGDFSQAMIYILMAIYVAPFANLIYRGQSMYDAIDDISLGVFSSYNNSRFARMSYMLAMVNDMTSPVAEHSYEYDNARYCGQFTSILTDLGYHDASMSLVKELEDYVQSRLPDKSEPFVKMNNYLSELYVELGEYQSAKRVLELGEIDDTVLNANRRIMKAYITALSGTPGDAVDLLRDFDINIYKDPITKAYKLYIEAKIFMSNGDDVTATELLLKALTYFGKDGEERVLYNDIKYALGMAMLNTGELSKSEQLLESALQYFLRVYCPVPPLNMKSAKNVNRDIILAYTHNVLYDSDVEDKLMSTISLSTRTLSRLMDSLTSMPIGMPPTGAEDVVTTACQSGELYGKLMRVKESLSNEINSILLKSLGAYVTISEQQIFNNAINLWLLCYRPHNKRILDTYDALIKAERKLGNDIKTHQYMKEKDVALQNGEFLDGIPIDTDKNIWWRCARHMLDIVENGFKE